MKFTFENLGYFKKESSIELGDLIIICGYNNTGKTYASYAIFGFLNTLWQIKNFDFDFDIPTDSLKEELYNSGKIQLDLADFIHNIPEFLDAVSSKYTSSLHEIFNTHKNFFELTNFSLSFPINHEVIKEQLKKHNYGGGGYGDMHSFFDHDKPVNSSVLTISRDKVLEKSRIPYENKEDFLSSTLHDRMIPSLILRMLLINYLPRAFIISSERTGISLFQRELDAHKNLVIRKLQNTDDPSQMAELINHVTARYALPIQEDIEFVRDMMGFYSKQQSQLIEEHPEFLDLIQEIIGGEYKIENEQMSFAFEGNQAERKIPIYIASSSAKSLLKLYFYITSVAAKGDMLMIDEPELNLHPAKQRQLAKLFARLIKAGIKVFITTHSDYLIKELNNLIMLNGEFDCKDELLEKLNYSVEDHLDPERVKVYISENHTLSPAPITEYGIEVDSFDKEIDAINQAFQEITLAKGI